MHKPSKYVWHDTGKSRPFGRENLFSKKTPKNSLFRRQQIWVSWLTVQTSYVEGQWHRNWAHNRPQKFLWGTATEITEKRNFFTLRPITQKRREILGWAIKGGKPDIHEGTPLGENWLRSSFDPALVVRSRLRATKCVPLAKLWGVKKKPHSHNFRNWACPLKSLLPIVYGKKWFKFASSILKTLGVGFICNTANMLLFSENRVNFSRP